MADTVVTPAFAQWLQATADFAFLADVTAQGRWGAGGVTSERLTGIATRADAQVEAERQLAFFSRGPFALDVHSVVGTDWAGDRGRVVTLAIDQLGYDAGIDVFVLEVEEDRATGLSSLTVLRPLKGVS